MSKYLVLSTFDNPAGGQGYFLYKDLLEHGEEAFFLPLIRQYSDHDHFFINARGKYSLRRIWYALLIRLQRCLLFKKSADYHSFFNLLMRGKSAKAILGRTPFVPDVIVIGWCDGYVSSKTISELYHQTHARIIKPMVDAFMLGGGCHYPCHQYESGCLHCPALRFPFLARKEFNYRLRYLKDVPFSLVGSGFDMERANKCLFLQNKKKIKSVGVPSIPFTMDKDTARQNFGIPSEHFVILFGAVDVTSKRKGFDVLFQSLELLSDKVSAERPVTLLVAGLLNQDISLPGLHIVSPGLLSLNDLYKAYYAADVFVSPSLEDSGPYMVNYSIACGRPVISFRIGIALDLVIPGETGYIAQYNDPNDLCRGLILFSEMSRTELNEYQNRCLSLMEAYRKKDSQMFDRIFRSCKQPILTYCKKK